MIGYENKVGKVWIHVGFMRAFGFGFNVSKYGLNIELLCFYGGLEW